MRIAEPTPLGLTDFRAMTRAIVAASFVKSPAGRRVVGGASGLIHRSGVAIVPSSDLPTTRRSGGEGTRKSSVETIGFEVDRSQTGAPFLGRPTSRRRSRSTSDALPSR
jgi:hypothetical protein